MGDNLKTVPGAETTVQQLCNSFSLGSWTKSVMTVEINGAECKL